MSQSPSNKAAWDSKANAATFDVRTAPYTKPRANEIVVKNHAVAINPADWIKQQAGTFMYSWVKYPTILGTDLAGEVVEVGSGVNRFKIGDRVISQAPGLNENYNTAAGSAFQNYTIVFEHMVSPIPHSMSYESAAVIPLGVSTAACGLFEKDHLGLQYPTSPPRKSTGKTVLIWGGSTSVGCNAVQLAVAAGYEVFATSSPRNFELLKKLGASQVFDYNSPTVNSDIIRAFKGKTSAGALAIGGGSSNACMTIVQQCQGNKFVSMATAPLPLPIPKTFMIPKIMIAVLPWFISNFFKAKIQGIGNKFIFATTLFDNGVGKAVYTDYLPKALEQGEFVAAPDPLVVGHGLEHIQTGLDMQQEGVSAKKIVVTL